MSRRSLVPLVLSSVALATGCRSSDVPPPPQAQAVGSAVPATTAASSANRLKLVVLVVIDQLPTWSFERDRAALTHGIGRLLASGTYFSHAEYPYANTYTATGHAALSTGTPSRLSGIIDNKWFHRDSQRLLDSTADDESPTLPGIPGAVVGSGQSSQWLKAPGISDALAAATSGRAHAVTVSLKPRAAILVAGQAGALPIWYDESQPAMTTSRRYAAAVPTWLVEFNRSHPIAERLAVTWQPGDAALLARLTGNVDDGIGEGVSEGGLGKVFPHTPAKARLPTEALVATPMGTELAFDTAEAALVGESLGKDDVVDYLAISISSHDYAGHTWGQESWERTDLLLRLDERLGRFLDRLDTEVGKGRYAVVLTSDHGAVPLIERHRDAGGPGLAPRRVSRAEIIAAADRGARRILGDGSWASSVAGNTIFMSDRFRALPAARQSETLDAIVAEVKKVPNMGLVAPTASLIGDCAAKSGVAERLACNSLAPDLVGEVFASLSDGSLLTNTDTTGTGHGSPSELERRVPVIVSRPGQAAVTDDRPTSMLRVAPTITTLLGVPPPALASEPPLEEPAR